MDQDWKNEQLQALQKQEARQRQNPSLSHTKRTLRPDPRWPPVKFKDPFTRDPTMLFRSEDPTARIWAPPMNSSQTGHTGLQPVKYTKVALVQPIGQFPKDTVFEVATVNYLTGQVKLFHTENESFQNITAFDDVVRVRQEHKAYNNLFYIREIIAFLQRGHSLLEPSCRCVHPFDQPRARELGISLPMERKGGVVDKASNRDGHCTLSRHRCARTPQELAAEIAVGDLYATEDAEGKKLVDALRENPKIVVVEPEGKEGWHRFAFRATYERVENKIELLEYVNSVDLCLKEPTEKDMYNGVKQDLEKLKEDEEIFSLDNKELRCAIIFPRKKNYELQVDDDIKALWREKATPVVRAEEMERTLMKEGLTPTKQEARKKEAHKKKGGQKRKRSSKAKAAKHEHYKLPTM